ncbi:ECF RNA polymerase sigma factor SigW [Clostridiales bacterium]|nr:ECF RNA polymerase sigma factor SigW [Clostridiales bacterium]
MNIEELTGIINQYGKDIYNFCLKLTMSKNEADELYQEAFLSTMDKINFQKNPKSFLMGTALRLWKNKKRKFAWRIRIMPNGEPDERREYCLTPEDEYMKKEEHEIVLRAVNNLREPLRQTVLLHYCGELTMEEIAKIMRIPVGTVKSRLYKARKLLKNILEADINGY